MAKKKSEAEPAPVVYDCNLRTTAEMDEFVRAYAAQHGIGVAEATTALLQVSRGRLAALKKYNDKQPKDAKPKKPAKKAAAKKDAKPKKPAKKAAAKKDAKPKKASTKAPRAAKRTVTELEDTGGADLVD